MSFSHWLSHSQVCVESLQWELSGGDVTSDWNPDVIRHTHAISLFCGFPDGPEDLRVDRRCSHTFHICRASLLHGSSGELEDQSPDFYLLYTLSLYKVFFLCELCGQLEHRNSDSGFY